MHNELSTLKTPFTIPDECPTPQRISGNSIAYSWLYVASLIVVTSLKNGDKNTALSPRQLAHTAPCNGNITNSLAPPTFQNTPNPYLPMARPRYLPPSVQTRRDGIPSDLRGVIIRNSHSVATLLLAVPVALGATSQAGVLIVLTEASALMRALSLTWWCFAQSCTDSFSKIKWQAPALVRLTGIKGLGSRASS